VSSRLQSGIAATHSSNGGQKRQVPNVSYATRARQQMDFCQSRSHWQLPCVRRSAQKTQQLRLGKHHSETAAVSNKTLHKFGKGTAAVQTVRARYALIHAQERLWLFAKEGFYTVTFIILTMLSIYFPLLSGY